jgi:hypothetical protein
MASYFALGVGVGVGEVAVRNDPLLLVPWTVVASFGFGVGEVAPRSDALLFDDLTVVIPCGLGVGLGRGVCSLYTFDLLLLRLMAGFLGVGVGVTLSLAFAAAKPPSVASNAITRINLSECFMVGTP